MLEEIGNHIWQSTVYCLFIALIILLLRKNGANIRYWLWFSVIIKFFIPFSLFVAIGGALSISLGPTTEITVPSTTLYSTTELMLQPFSQTGVSSAVSPAAQTTAAAATSSSLDFGEIVRNGILVIWALGTLIILARWFLKWRKLQSALSNAVINNNIDFPVPVKTAPIKLEPGIIGIVRPVLFIPEHLADHLNDREMKAVLAHELTHLQRKDNLTAAVYMVVAAVFWFHPLLWWIGARLMEEREKACDEAVANSDTDSKDYAESILKVCQYCMTAPLACVAGVSGADLKSRITAIMMKNHIEGLTMIKKTILTGVALAVIATPIFIGVFKAPTAMAQEQTTTNSDGLSFESAEISLGDIDSRNKALQVIQGGGMNIRNYPLKGVISYAFKTQQSEVQGPEWLSTQAINIDAVGKPSGLPVTDMEVAMDRIRTRLRRLLEADMGLVTHTQRVQMPVYALTQADGGHKLSVSSSGAGPALGFRDKGLASVRSFTIQNFSAWMGGYTDRPIVDQTGLTERYNFTVQWTVPEGVSGLAALTPNLEQLQEALDKLGLTLVEKEAEVKILVVEDINLPDDSTAQRPSFDLEYATFDSYAGHYEYPGSRLFSVFRQDDKFFAQVTGDEPVEILAKSKNEFVIKRSGNKFEVELDPITGNGSKLIYRAGADTVIMERLDEDEAQLISERIANRILDQARLLAD